MRYAETGYNLEVDLSQGTVERVETDPELTRLYLGGLGTNAKILWDRVPPEVEAFSPDNLLIFSAGLLVGTPAPGANRTIVSAFSPVNSFMAFCMMGGFWAAELKHAGYDKVIVRGRAPDLVYLWIHDDRVEIRDARHLQGKGALETAELIKEEVGEPKAQVLAIGLAGENRVYFASIEHNRASASRLGIGAVMGDKRLKAIAVRGTKDVPVAKPAEMFKLCQEVIRYIRYREENPLKGLPPGLEHFGRLGIGMTRMLEDRFHTDNFAWGHARIRRKGYWNEEVERKWGEVWNRRVERSVGCYNCPLGCGILISHPELKTGRYMMKCYSKLNYLMAAMVDDLEFDFNIAGYAQEYGVDAFTAPQVIAFAIELYENGILTEQDMPGFPSRNDERFFWLLERIARREGIGDILANGVYRAARQIGRGAEAFDHNTTKKVEQMNIKLGMLNPLYYLMYSTGEKANIVQIEGQIPQSPLLKELREEFVKDWIQVPTGKEEKFKEFVLKWEPRGEYSFPFWPPVDTVCELVEWQEMMHYLDDCTGICAGLSSFVYKPPYHVHNLPLIISAATGFDLDEEGLTQIFRRVRNLVRAINVRKGLRREEERPPENHWKQRFPDYEAKLLDEYYKFKGWDTRGIPTGETLDRLGLDYVREDLERRGIL